AEDKRTPDLLKDQAFEEEIRFRTLGCYPLTGAVKSSAKNVKEIIEELKQSDESERQGRVIDSDGSGYGMEIKKKEGYF
ncbi:MAG: sulfate adenylyltransferase subunit 2, partial [Lentimonas sp.]